MAWFGPERMLVLGLTGSIGMGKSTAATMFRHLGLPVYDADASVHGIFESNASAITLISRRFPEALTKRNHRPSEAWKNSVRQHGGAG